MARILTISPRTKLGQVLLGGLVSLAALSSGCSSGTDDVRGVGGDSVPADASIYSAAVVSQADEAFWTGGGLVGEPGSWKPVGKLVGYGPDGAILRTAEIPPPDGLFWFNLQVAGDAPTVVAAACETPTTAETPGCAGTARLFRIDGRSGKATQLVGTDGKAVTAHLGLFSLLGQKSDGSAVLAIQSGPETIPGFAPVQVVELSNDGTALSTASLPQANVRWICMVPEGSVYQATPNLDNMMRVGSVSVGKLTEGGVTSFAEVAGMPADLMQGKVACTAGSVFLVGAGSTVVAAVVSLKDGAVKSIGLESGAVSPQLDALLPAPQGGATVSIRSGDGKRTVAFLLNSDGTTKLLASQDNAEYRPLAVIVEGDSSSFVDVAPASWTPPDGATINFERVG